MQVCPSDKDRSKGGQFVHNHHCIGKLPFFPRTIVASLLSNRHFGPHNRNQNRCQQTPFMDSIHTKNVSVVGLCPGPHWEILQRSPRFRTGFGGYFAMGGKQENKGEGYKLGMIERGEGRGEGDGLAPKRVRRIC